MKLDPRNTLIVAIPSYDGRSISSTIVSLYQIAFALKRNIYWILPQGTGISSVRTAVVRECDAMIEPRSDLDFISYHYVLWLDSDVKLNCKHDELIRIADWIRRAEEKKIGICGSCHIAVNSGGAWKNNLFRKREEGMPPETYTTEELDEAAPMSLRVWSSGLAIAYLKVPCGYVFHEDGNLGEDGYFFKECNQEIYFVPIPNFHQKLMMI